MKQTGQNLGWQLHRQLPSIHNCHGERNPMRGLISRHVVTVEGQCFLEPETKTWRHEIQKVWEGLDFHRAGSSLRFSLRGTMLRYLQFDPSLQQSACLLIAANFVTNVHMIMSCKLYMLAAIESRY